VSHKQLARARWGEIHRISPHEKKKKISLGQKYSGENIEAKIPWESFTFLGEKQSRTKKWRKYLVKYGQA
jgi:hypothetical protein